VDPLVEFLYTVLDRYLRVAAEAGAETWVSVDHIDGTVIAAFTDDGDRDIAVLASSEWDEGTHIALHNPQAVLAWVRAQRQLVQHLDALITTAGSVIDDPMAATLLTGAATRALRLMAQPYTRSPGYNPAWSIH